MRNPYSTYRGRKNWLRRILIAIVILLAIALVAAVIGSFFLQNYVEYTPDGVRLVIPFFGGGKTAAPSPTVGVAGPTPSADDDIIIDQPTQTSQAPASPTPKPEFYPRRDTPLGLVGYEFPRLLDGSAKESLASNRGAVFNMDWFYHSFLDGVDFADIRAANQALPYSVALVPCFGADGTPDAYADDVIDWCKTVAGLGFDEIVLSNADYTAFLDAHSPDDMRGVTPDEKKVTTFYSDLRAALDDLGYEGRLSVVCAKETFRNGLSEGYQSGQAVADNFERVYVPGGNWGGFNLYKALKDMGFSGTTADIVTTVTKPISANYSWAILPY